MPYLRVKNELPLIPGYSEGAIAYAPDAADAPLNECICYINPVQSGSGDPSPSNVRPITGHTELNLVQKNDNDTVVHTYTTALGTTVYGGTLDVVSGVLTIDKVALTFADLDFSNSSPENHVFRGNYNGTYYSSMKFPSSQQVATEDITEQYKAMAFSPISASDDGKFALAHFTDSQVARFVFIDNNYSTLSDFTTARNSDKIIITLATPITIQLTTREVKSLLGSNNFYHDCNGDTKVIYIRRLDS